MQLLRIKYFFLTMTFTILINQLPAQLVFSDSFPSSVLNTSIWTPVTFTGHGPGQCAVTCVSPGCCESSSYLMTNGCSTFGIQTNLSAFSSGADCNNVGSTARAMFTHIFSVPSTIVNPIIKVSGKRQSISLGPYGTVRSGVLVDIDGTDGSGNPQTNFKVFFDVDRAGFDNVRDKCADCTNPYSLDIFVGGAGSTICSNVDIDIKAILGWQCVSGLNSITLLSRCGNCVIGASSTTSYSYLYDDVSVYAAANCSTPVCSNPPFANISSSANVTCFGGNNGSATVTPSSGTPGYTYFWSPSGGTNATTSGLTAGTYIANVTDANGCTATATITITEPTALSASITQSNVSCNGLNDGSTTVTPSGGIPGYTYSWNTLPSQTAPTASNLYAGTYTVTVTDTNLCITNTTVTITQPALLPSTSAKEPGSGNTLIFDGVSDYVNCGNNPGLNLNGNFTIETWVYIDALPASEATILSKGNNSNNKGYKITLSPTGTIIIYTGSGAWLSRTSAQMLTSNRWHHIAWVHKNGLSEELYIDGIVQSFTSLSTPSYTGMDVFTFGAYYNGGSVTFYLTGRIDETRVWDRALTVTELRKKLASKFSDCPNPDLIGYWRFDEGVDGTCPCTKDICDASCYGNHGKKF